MLFLTKEMTSINKFKSINEVENRIMNFGYIIRNVGEINNKLR